MKVIIIGAGACGGSCATRLRRLDETAQITLLSKRKEISVATCGLPYFLSGIVEDKDNLLASSEERFRQLFQIDIRTQTRVESINRREKTVTLENGKKLLYDKLVLALGAESLIPEIPGLKGNPRVFTARTLSDYEKIKEFIKSESVKQALVIGGGFVGVEVAENLSHIGIQTTLAEAAPHILSSFDEDIAAFAQNELREKGINLRLNAEIKEVRENTALLKNGEEIPYNLIILAGGTRADTQIAKEAGLQTGPNGAILVNEYLQTNDENIYAGGDCIAFKDMVSEQERWIGLAGPANRQGRIIADNLKGIKSRQQKNLGSGIIKVFDRTLARTGATESQLQINKIPYQKIHVWGASHTGYYPGAQPMLLKLLFAPDGKILGAQGAGGDGVDKRLDIIASFMLKQGTVLDLADAELCYAPPYTTAKDPVNILGMVAGNVLNQLTKLSFFNDIGPDTFLLDVRSYEGDPIAADAPSGHIPLSRLEESLDLLPKNKKIILFCDSGFTSYLAFRILIQNGIKDISSLSGGIRLYREMLKNKKDSAG